MPSPLPVLNRRRFLQISCLAGGGLALTLGLNRCDTKKSKDEAERAAPGAWIRLDGDSTVTVIVNHSEMGQGITTALAMIVAEELDADWNKVRFEIAPVAEVYKHPHYGLQWTVSSRSVESSWSILRQAGATLRLILLQAAAQLWGVPEISCHAENGRIHHRDSGRTLAYGELLETAATLPLPPGAAFKQPKDFKIIGQPLARLDGAAKIDGSAKFGTDIRLPGMLAATVIHPPVYGEKPGGLNAAEIKQMPGGRHVMEIATGVAIVADTVWQALDAGTRLKVDWKASPRRHVNSIQLWRQWRDLGNRPGAVVYRLGEKVSDEVSAAWSLTASYDLPYQAHATMEPMNCTADVREDGCDIWAPTQNQQGARDIVARLTGLPPKTIHIHTVYLGCGFGRRALVDYVGEAVELSMRVKAPVKVIWSREEDINRDFFRPATHNVMKAQVDERGRPLAWLQRIVGADAFGQAMPKVIPAMLGDAVPVLLKNGVALAAESLGPALISGKKAAIGAGPLPYRIPRLQVEFVNDDPGFPLCWWRSVAPSSNCFAVECFLDEIAAKVGRDPLDLRQELLADNPRLLEVLRLAAQKSEWGERPGTGRFRGMACHDFQETMMAMVAEVSLDDKGVVRVHKVVCALDCGIAINPKIIRAQVESGIAFGLTATLKGAITFERGAVQQSNFDNFPLLRFDEMPEVETHIIASDRPPTGIGEAAVPVIGPAVANAVFAATGKPVRKVPIL